MTEQNAVRKMSTVGNVERCGKQLYVKANGHILSVYVQDGQTVGMFHTKSAKEQNDVTTDYFPGTYWKSFNSAVKYGLN